MTLKAPTGVFDILPQIKNDSDLWCTSSLWRYIEKMAYSVAHDYGFHEIRTPIFERVELFKRTVGDVTDIVSKEMYVFKDRGERELALRPEGTASVMRALIEHQFFAPVYDLRLFYIGPMFRYERPQAGRFRQHHQFGMEVIGVSSYEQDAEMIEALYTFYQRLDIPDLTVCVNSLGSSAARDAFREALVGYLRPLKGKLSEESQLRLEKNPLRILDSKDQGDQEIVNQAPNILDFLSLEDRAHFEGLLRSLDLLKIPYKIEPKLVRGLDYYQRTVFEVTTGALGAQNTIGAGGRYDGLLRQMGGPDLPSIGFATGLERVIQTMLNVHSQEMKSRAYSMKEEVHLLLIPMGEKAMDYAMQLARKLRSRHIRVVVDMTGKKLKASMSSASQSNVQSVIVLGDQEIETGRARLKYLKTQEEVDLSLSSEEMNLADIIQKLAK